MKIPSQFEFSEMKNKWIGIEKLVIKNRLRVPKQFMKIRTFNIWENAWLNSMNHKIHNLTLQISGHKICQSEAKENVEWVFTTKHKIKPGMGPQKPIIFGKGGGWWFCSWLLVAWWRENGAAMAGDWFTFVNSASPGITFNEAIMMRGGTDWRCRGHRIHGNMVL